jgi:hypothetical protein
LLWSRVSLNQPDAFAVAERWLELITPKLDEHRSTLRGRGYVLIDDITPALTANPST